ncbi:hypothetical protein WA026_019001 [Henosepilachna vigintioctopunctata]|uniref:Uncharacterized protein n=1 Tax=Henosepilachna vigintioctopunctata TaxID=420089 RepID=A0AAW1V903_9CUCU
MSGSELEEIAKKDKTNQEKKLLENQTKLSEKVQYLESVIEKKVNTDNVNEIDNHRSNQGQIGVRKRNLKECNSASVTVSSTRETHNLLTKTTEQTTKPNLEMNNDNNESALLHEKSNKDYNTSLKANSSLLNEQDWTEVQYNKKKQKASHANKNIICNRTVRKLKSSKQLQSENGFTLAELLVSKSLKMIYFNT